MTSRTSTPDAGPIPLGASPDLSVAIGGPLFRFLCRAHLSDDALGLVRKRVFVIAMFAWLPLLVLSALQGRMLPGTATIPFLLDVEAHVRFLVVLPLLIIAELVVHQRMPAIVRQFRECNLIPDGAQARFSAAIASASRLRDSALVELLLVALVYGVGILVIWRQYVALNATSWYAAPSGDDIKLSLAGAWYGYISLPIFQFLLVRWYFRLFVWARFLWQISRIQLRLVPTHPDCVGGLGFLGSTVFLFTVFAAAQGALVAGHLANRILFLGGSLPDFKFEIAGVLVLVLCVVFGPLLMFALQLEAAKRRGLREYGALAERYVREFDGKWMRGGRPAGELLMGSADIQSLADLGNAYEVVKTIRDAPITRGGVLRIAFAVLAPIAPLLLTMMSLEELTKRLFAVLY